MFIWKKTSNMSFYVHALLRRKIIYLSTSQFLFILLDKSYTIIQLFNAHLMYILKIICNFQILFM